MHAFRRLIAGGVLDPVATDEIAYSVTIGLPVHGL